MPRQHVFVCVHLVAVTPTWEQGPLRRGAVEVSFFQSTEAQHAALVRPSDPLPGHEPAKKWPFRGQFFFLKQIAHEVCLLRFFHVCVLNQFVCSLKGFILGGPIKTLEADFLLSSADLWKHSL